MKVQALSVTALLLVLLSSALALSEALGDHTSTLKGQPGAEGHGEDPRAPGDGGDNLPRQGLVGSHPLAGAWEVMGEASPSSGSPSRALAKPSLGSSEQRPPSKLRRLPRQPSRSRIPGLSHHLKGHGKFNGDTHSCHGIHSRPCQKPSDCSGCLGLYTCKLPAGTCDLKAVSRQRGR
ncbi:pseudouridine-metabolizing bifunctional [Limosa lapponica baueri]|uniref:Pseudouridine-metabolizing bifunctional n=1 Tax=Limosa lapponica baueri TaxID=1758121 RepID=A0A2I0TQH3_LIMLA|nr:pseudouridine-metabolizing bifunctional [Limosa lapponica baueri]